MAGELAAWFVHHAQTMDAALALHLRSAGFDPATGSLAHPRPCPSSPSRAAAVHATAASTARGPCRPDPAGLQSASQPAQGTIAGEARMGKIFTSPPAITSTARAARIRPMSRVITLMPVLPSTRAIGSASEKQTITTSATTTP